MRHDYLGPEEPGQALGNGIAFLGYELVRIPASSSTLPKLQLTLHWQALAPMDTGYKVFVHLLGEGGPADVRAQADVWPHLSTTGWVPGEYLSDQVALHPEAGLPEGWYTILVGLYDEDTGLRLPVLDAAGQVVGDSLVLEQVRLRE